VFVIFSSKTPELAAQSVNLTWDPNTETDLAGYRLYHGMDSGVYGTPIDIGETTQFTPSNLAEGETYYYSVTAYDESGNESYLSQEVNIHVPDTVPPSIPTGLKAIPTSSLEVALSWDASTDNGRIAGYQLNRNTMPLANTGGTLSYLDDSVTQEVTYSYTVQAFDEEGNYSSPSTPATIEVTTSTSLLSVSLGGSGTVTSSPGSLVCSSGTCSSSFVTGSSVTLMAQPAKRWKFSGWSGACSGSMECVMQLTTDESVMATFSRKGGGGGRKGGPKK
jgi:chitodextrinase